MAKQVIYRRGTTAEHANFVGANGEITVDTVKHVVIVHDGVTAGGFPLANSSAVNASISSLTANAANQATTITVLQANAATQSNAIVALQSNAVVQQAAIDAFTLASNSTVIFANIAGVRANVEAANVQIGLLYGNATIQNEAIVLANANITALQSSITAANLAIASFVTGSGFANIEQLTANITAVNSAISTQGVTFATNVAVAGVRANVTAANSAISSLQANIAAANVAINNIALSPSLIAGVTAAVTSGNLVPTQANVYTLGTPEFPWNHLYVGTGSITIGNVTLSSTDGNLTFGGGGNLLSSLSGTTFTAKNMPDPSYAPNAFGADYEILNVFHRGIEFYGTNSSGSITYNDSDVENNYLNQFWEFSGRGIKTGGNVQVGQGPYAEGVNVPGVVFSDGTIQRTANIMLAAFTMANSQQWTSNVSTIGAALNQLAARLKAAGF
jgi:hypothetical protein